MVIWLERCSKGKKWIVEMSKDADWEEQPKCRKGKIYKNEFSQKEKVKK